MRIFLKRTRFEKVTTKLSLPLQLNLGAYQIQDADRPVRNTPYDLIGIVVHQGPLNGGHYWAYTRNGSTGPWYRCEDNVVIPAPDDEIDNLQKEGRVGRAHAYLLFYQEHGTAVPVLPIAPVAAPARPAPVPAPVTIANPEIRTEPPAAQIATPPVLAAEKKTTKPQTMWDTLCSTLCFWKRKPAQTGVTQSAGTKHGREGKKQSGKKRERKGM